MKENKLLKTSLGILFSLLIALLVCLPCFAAEQSGSVVTGYYVSSDTVDKYDVINIIVYVKNFGMKTQDIGNEDDIEITHCLDSFSGKAEPLVKILSKSGEVLRYSVDFSGYCCKDTTGNFSFIATYNGQTDDRETLSFTVTECGAAPSAPSHEPDTQIPSATTSPADDEPMLPVTTTSQSDNPKEPTEPTSAGQQPAPLVRITRSDITKKLTANSEFVLNVSFANTCSPYAITGGIATFEPSEGLVLNENSSSKSLPVIAVGGKQSIAVKMKVASQAENAVQSVTVSCRYNYKTPEGIVQGTETEKLNIIVVPTGTTTAAGSQHATPNIIISKYNYGAEAVAAGESFNLSLQFKNTSKELKVENIVMAIESGEGISITSSSNTFYYDSLAATKALSQKVGLNVSANIATIGAKLNITFRYEYVDGGSRSNSTCSESLSIPIYIPDRFTITPPESVFATANEEATISVSYVNKSKSPVSNVEAVLEFDDAAVYCELPTQNLGNFESGKSGTIDFFLTPSVEGETSVTVIITYETEMLETKTVKIPLTFNVDPAADYGFEEPITDVMSGEETGKKVPVAVIIALIVVAIVVVIVVIAVVRKKKKKKAAEIPADFDWNIAPSPDAQPEKQEVKADETN